MYESWMSWYFEFNPAKSKNVYWINHDKTRMKAQWNRDFIKWRYPKVSSKLDHFNIETNGGDWGSTISRNPQFWRVFMSSHEFSSHPFTNSPTLPSLKMQDEFPSHKGRCCGDVREPEVQDVIYACDVLPCWTWSLQLTVWNEIWMTASTQVGNFSWVSWWWVLSDFMEIWGIESGQSREFQQHLLGMSTQIKISINQQINQIKLINAEWIYQCTIHTENTYTHIVNKNRRVVRQFGMLVYR